MAAAPIAIGMMAASHLFQGATENKALRADARVDMENARRTELDGEYQAEDIMRRERALAGDAIVALGANGVGVGTGSAADLLYQSAVEREYDIISRRYESATSAASLRQQAAGKKKAGRNALFGGVLRAGASAVTGISDMNNASALRQSNAATRAAQLPGGQQLPIPAALTEGRTAYTPAFNGWAGGDYGLAGR